MTKKTELAEKEQTAIVALDFGADAGAGMEGAGVESFAIPFLTALQKISPQCEETDAKFIPEARGGMLFNSVTGRLYDGKTGVVFLPAAYQRRFLRWGPRGGEGGGFKGELMPEVVAEMQADGRLVEVEGTWYVPGADGTVVPKKCDRVADVRNHFGILIDEATGGYTQVLLSLGSTQIKKSKLLMSNLSAVKVKRASDGAMVTPPTWANRVRITTVPESNDKGSWYGYKMELDGFVASPEHYAAAKAFHAALRAGTAGSVNYTDAAPEGAVDDRNEKF